MSFCIRHYPHLAKPYSNKFINQLSDQKAHPAGKRNIVRLLQFIEIPKRLHGWLMNICFQIINTPGEAIAVKVFSLRILENLSVIYPEILPEFKTIINARLPFESAAFRSRAGKILRKIRKIEYLELNLNNLFRINEFGLIFFCFNRPYFYAG